MKLIALCDGHGMQTSGKRTPTLPNGLKSETGNFMHENEFNRAAVKYLDAELKRNGFKTLLVAPTDSDTSLEARTALANSKKADIYVSIHANANTGKWGTWGGMETFVSKGSKDSERLGNAIHKYLKQGSKQRDRGVQEGNHLWVIRKTDMPAVLVEAGFMDNLEEAKLLLSDAYRKECAVEIAKGICEYFGVTYKAYKAPSKGSTTSKTHTVVNGDTLWDLSRKYKITVDSLKKLNSLKSDALTPGMKLKIGAAVTAPKPPVSKPKYHTVKSGDTLSEIADKYKTTTAKLDALNPAVKNINKISIGQKIRVA
jgi:N-acetylmuramoyl-L-alanine amidase